MSTCVYPGSFDPITMGHFDLIQRASGMFDRVVVGILNNTDKHPTFAVEERLTLVRRSVGSLANVEVASFNGLLVDFVQQCGANVILRGLRAISDFEYEFQMAATNHRLAPEVETVFLMTSTEYSFLSSSIVRQLGSFGGNIQGMVPEAIREEVVRRLRPGNGQEERI